MTTVDAGSPVGNQWELRVTRAKTQGSFNIPTYCILHTGVGMNTLEKYWTGSNNAR